MAIVFTHRQYIEQHNRHKQYIEQHNSLINFTGSFFDMYLYITSYQGNREDMNSNKEIYSVLKFRVVCHVIGLLLAVLQWH